MKFRVPENGIFSDPAVHNFQFKLLTTELSRDNEDRKRYEEMLMKASSLVQKNRQTVVGIHFPLREASN